MTDDRTRYDESSILKLKSVIENTSCPSSSLLDSLHLLKSYGTLPVDILKRTMIGKSIKSLTKKPVSEDVKLLAKTLEQDWRCAFREAHAPKLEAKDTETVDANKGGTPTETTQNARVAGNDSAPPTKKAKTEHSKQHDKESRSMRCSFQDIVASSLTAFRDSHDLSKVDINSNGKLSLDKDLFALAAEIEKEMHAQLPHERDYRAQARALCFNLKDKRNIAFKWKLMLGLYTPQEVPKLTAEDMASDERRNQRIEIRREAMNAVDSARDSKISSLMGLGTFSCESCQSSSTTHFQIPSGKPDTAPTIVVVCLDCGCRSNIQEKEC